MPDIRLPNSPVTVYPVFVFKYKLHIRHGCSTTWKYYAGSPVTVTLYFYLETFTESRFTGIFILRRWHIQHYLYVPAVVCHASTSMTLDIRLPNYTVTIHPVLDSIFAYPWWISLSVHLIILDSGPANYGQFHVYIVLILYYPSCHAIKFSTCIPWWLRSDCSAWSTVTRYLFKPRAQ